MKWCAGQIRRMLLVAAIGWILPQALWAMQHNDSSATLKTVFFHGNKRLSDSRLKSAIASKEDAGYDPHLVDEDRVRILALYEKQLYFLASIDSCRTEFSRDGMSVSLHYYITENRPVVIDTILFTGSTRWSDDRLSRLLTSTPGRMFDPQRFAEDLEAILTLHEDGGYPMARVSCDRFEFLIRNNQAVIRITVGVDAGPPVVLRKLEFTGLTQTRESVLRREMRLNLPTAYRETEIGEQIGRLRRLSFIDRVEDPQLIRYNDSSYALRIHVEEGQSNSVDGIAGYVPARTGTDEKGYFTGLMNLSFQNLFGTARRLDALWQKKNRYTQEFRLAYTEPWVLDYPVNLSFSIQQLVQDTIFVERQWTLDGAVWLGSDWEGLFGGKSRTVDPAGDANGFVFNIPSASFLSGYVGIRYDIRDDRINPRRGVLYAASVEYGSKKENYFVQSADGLDTLVIPSGPVIGQWVDDDMAVQKWMMDFEWMTEIRRHVVMFTATHAAFYKSPQAVVPYSEQYRFGGLRSVRGYVEDFFNGTRVGWNNLELRWLTGRRSRIFVFFDTGYYYRTEYSDASRTQVIRRHGWPMGYGFGLRYQTRLGLFGLDYGLGKADAFSSGKVHFGITSQF